MALPRALQRLFAAILPQRPFGSGMGWSGAAPIYFAPGGASPASFQISNNPEGALASCPYASAIKVLSEDVAKLPLVVKESYINPATGATEERRVEGGVARLLSTRPNEELTAYEFKRLLIYWKLAWGNGYAAIQRSAGGQAVSLLPVHPCRVEVEREPGGGALYYDVWNEGQGRTRVEARDMIHLKNMSPDGMSGLSMATLAAVTISAGLAQDSHGEKFFRNGGRPSGVLEHPGVLSDGARNNLAADWAKAYGSGNAYRTAILEGGMKYNALSMPNTDAQFLESRRFTVQEVARWFRLPPSKLQDMSSATLTNIEEMGRSYLEDSLMAHLVEFEQELSAKLLTAKRHAEFVTASLTMGRGVERAQYHNAGIMGGWKTINDVRKAEGLNPFDDPLANVPLVQGAIVPLSRIATATPGGAPAANGTPEPSDPIVADKRVAAMMERTRLDILAKGNGNGHG